MDLDRRDTLDVALVTLALLLAISSLVDGSGTGSLVGDIGGAVTSIGPVTFLVVFATAGVLFLAYGLLYLPSRQGE